MFFVVGVAQRRPGPQREVLFVFRSTVCSGLAAVFCWLFAEIGQHRFQTHFTGARFGTETPCRCGIFITSEAGRSEGTRSRCGVGHFVPETDGADTQRQRLQLNKHDCELKKTAVLWN